MCPIEHLKHLKMRKRECILGLSVMETFSCNEGYVEHASASC